MSSSSLGRRIDADHGARVGARQRAADPSELAERPSRWRGELAAGAPLAQRGNKRVISAVLEAQERLDPDVERELIELRARLLCL